MTLKRIYHLLWLGIGQLSLYNNYVITYLTMKKFLLLIDGMSGAGKSTTAGFLARELPRTAIVGFDKIKRFISDFKRGTRDNAISREVSIAMTQRYLELGMSVMVEQSFKSEQEIMAYEKLAKQNNIPCIKFQIHCNPEEALRRVIDRTARNNGDLPESRAKRNISLYNSRESLGFIQIDTTNKPPDYAFETIIQKIENLQ